MGSAVFFDTAARVDAVNDSLATCQVPQAGQREEIPRVEKVRVGFCFGGPGGGGVVEKI